MGTVQSSCVEFVVVSSFGDVVAGFVQLTTSPTGVCETVIVGVLAKSPAAFDDGAGIADGDCCDDKQVTVSNGGVFDVDVLAFGVFAMLVLRAFCAQPKSPLPAASIEDASPVDGERTLCGKSKRSGAVVSMAAAPESMLALLGSCGGDAVTVAVAFLVSDTDLMDSSVSLQSRIAWQLHGNNM